MVNFIGKKYLLDSSENFEAFMVAIGVPEQKRKFGNQMVITVQVLEDAGTFTIKTFSQFKNTEIVFRSGVEFDEETHEGSVVKSTIIVDNNKMVHTQKFPHVTTRIERTFTDQGITVVLTAGDVVCTRKFKVIEG